jgi:hypothetical protein
MIPKESFTVRIRPSLIQPYDRIIIVFTLWRVLDDDLDVDI